MAKSLRGTVALVDSAGNLITDLNAAQFDGVPRDESLRIHCGGHETLGLHANYAEQPELTFVAILNEAGQLELGIVGENAAAMLGIPAGTAVEVKWDS
ncbi:MAG: SAM-dependent chlorinase/fluorinase [Pirellulales bacterium]|nr:SAM-dependent chlorinase/fluorinase [Pirellulales bacterium]